jgi:hypothetical protein
MNLQILDQASYFCSLGDKLTFLPKFQNETNIQYVQVLTASSVKMIAF